MATIDLGNLTRYDGKIKEYAEDKYLSKNTANWQKTEKAGAVTCYPVPDTELEPIVDFMFTETPPVSGDKSPSNPSTITGVSNVTVTRCGKNLVRDLQTTTYRGVVFTANADGSITSNRISSDVNASFCYTTPKDILKIGLTYSLSGCPSGGSGSTYCQRFGEMTPRMDIGSGLTSEILATPNMSRGVIRIDSSYSPDNIVFWPQIELGSEITSFEKSEYEDYIINLNSTYYGGSVNLATGMMTVTHGKYVFTGTETGWSNNGNDGLHSYNATTGLGFTTINLNNYTNTVAVEGNSIMNYLPYMGTNESQVTDGIRTRACFCLVGGGTQLRFIVPFTSITDLKSWLASKYSTDNPVSITYKLANPIAIQLSPLKIKSLEGLDKNTPRLNTLYTNADSIQVGYQKHPARTAYELENAILALEGGE